VPELPSRRPAARVTAEPWLPVLGALTADEELGYRMGAVGPRGKAWLRAWGTPDDGTFALLVWTEGLVIPDVARPLRGMLAERFGEPFALAELSADAVDIILPPVPGQDQGWLRLFPAEETPYRGKLEAWWGVYGDTVLST
jgi:hypothetical protein